MKREKELIHNTIIVTIGKVSTQLITFFLLPLYTGVLTTSEYGTVDLFTTITSLLAPIVSMQIEQSLFRELVEARNQSKKKEEIISTGFSMILIQFVLGVFLTLAINYFVDIKYMPYLVCNVLVVVILALMMQIARGLGDNTRYATMSFISAICTIIFNILFLVVFHLGIVGMFLGSILGQGIAGIYAFFALELHNYIKINLIKAKWIRVFWHYSLPLIPNAISWWIFNASDRMIVSYVLGVASNGILAAVSKFSTIIVTIYNIYNVTWTEFVAVHYNDNDFEQLFNSILKRSMQIFLGLTSLLIAIMPIVFPVLINEAYSDGYDLIPILVFGAFFNVFVGLISVIYVAEKNTSKIALTSVVSATINIVTHALLIDYIGLYAAPISTLISFFAISMYRLFDLKKQGINICIEKNLIGKSIIFFTIEIVLFYHNFIWANVLSIIGAILYCYNINKEMLCVCLNKVKCRFYDLGK